MQASYRGFEIFLCVNILPDIGEIVLKWDKWITIVWLRSHEIGSTFSSVNLLNIFLIPEINDSSAMMERGAFALYFANIAWFLAFFQLPSGDAMFDFYWYLVWIQLSLRQQQHPVARNQWVRVRQKKQTNFQWKSNLIKKRGQIIMKSLSKD